MNDYEGAIELAYREAVAQLPYCAVSVKLLCERAGISRKSFYKRFGGKQDILVRIFARDVIEPQVELCHLFTFEKMSEYATNMERHMFGAVYSDGPFYRSIVLAPDGGRDAFAKAASGALCTFNEMLLDEFGYEGSALKAGYIAAFFADAKAQMMLRWIEEDYPLSADEAGDLYSRMALPFWDGIIHPK